MVSFVSYQTLLFCAELTVIATAIIIITSGFSYFTPTIIGALGYSTVQTQLHTVPPYAAALVLALLFAFASDRAGVRSPFIIICFTLTIVGLAILLSVDNSFPAQYAAICLVAMGAFCAGPLVVCWYVMNLNGHAARSIGSAWMISFGQTGGIVATFSFLATEAPQYAQGYAACLAVSCAGLASVIGYAALALRDNKELRSSLSDEVALRKFL